MNDNASRAAPVIRPWRIVALLSLANLMNFYDRTVPAIVIEPIKAEFGISDTQVGLLSAAFTIIYAVAGIFLGRMADTMSRRRIMGWGLIVWSLFTAACGGAWSFGALLFFRLGVGIGEASYAPAANSLISDLFPPEGRSRASAVFQLGLPIGLTLAFFTTGWIVEAFDSWRAPFLIAAVPGFIIALFLFRIPEPKRGASEPHFDPAHANLQPIRTILRIPTIWWLTLAGIGSQISAYTVATFMVPLFQRYFGLPLVAASVNSGIILGLTGVIGLLIGGLVADRAAQRSHRARLLVGALALGLSAPLTFAALVLPSDQVAAFIGLFFVGWLLQFFYYTSAYPAIADVVEPRLRATAMAVFFAAFYLLGGALGPVIAGALSDHFAAEARGVASDLSPEAIGLHTALLLVVPISIVATALGFIGAARTVERDHQRMRSGMTKNTDG